MNRSKILAWFVVLPLTALIFVACSSPAATPTPVALALAATAIPPALTNNDSQPSETLPPPTLAPTDSLTATPTTLPTDTATPLPTDTPTDTATPTNTSTPTETATPTNTPTLTPTNTPTHVPTPTRRPATATPKPLTLPDALKKSAATTYRIESHSYYSNPQREFETMTLTGEANGNVAHFMLGGILSLFLGGGPGKDAELILNGNTLYAKGPIPLLRANEDRWYLIPTSQSSLNPKGVLAADVVTFNKIGNEAVDDKQCDIYTIDKVAARRALQASGSLTQEQLDNTVNIEVTHWLCSDGYVRRSRVRVDVRDRQDPSTTDISRTEYHFFDFGAPVQITVPTNALPLPQ